ncbi:MAG: helix-turn-helix transcriptional regulator [Myxococcales bacterium]|nr:helix-turn-helix transcriptional regulator [Myxococcales bacterium]MCB9641984.1 helix-turn-helix transcriptional regulator [Myxococcales bacterium]
MAVSKEFSARIRARREAMGYTPEELATHVGIQGAYVERIEEGSYVPKPDVARRLAFALEEDEMDYMEWAGQRLESAEKPPSKPTPRPRYPEAREALIELCDDHEAARQLFSGSSIGPLEAALYGLLIDGMSQRMADFGFWGFLPPSDSARPHHTGAIDGPLLLEAFFEMLIHPEGEAADYKKVFSELISSWSYGPAPHHILARFPDGTERSYRLSLVDQQGSIIPALQPEDPFYALYRMLTNEQRAEIAEITRLFLRRDSRLEIQAALEALARWHKIPH